MEDRQPSEAELAALDRRTKSSPIFSLTKQFQASPFSAAPERLVELDRLIRNLEIRIQLVWPGTKFRFEVSNNRIYVGLNGLERL